MAKIVVLAMGLALAATSANAQINWGAAQIPDFGGGAMGAYRAGQAARRAQEQHDAHLQALRQLEVERAQQAAATQQSSTARADALTLAVNGKCNEALTVAARTSDPAFVRETMGICAALAPPSPAQ
jgi:hypothetical protein